nr:type II/IV secretion system protein [bacterium]
AGLPDGLHFAQGVPFEIKSATRCAHDLARGPATLVADGTLGSVFLFAADTQGPLEVRILTADGQEEQHTLTESFPARASGPVRGWRIEMLPLMLPAPRKEAYGMILVTGPTGSGKTTTLYAALNKINSSNRKIITIEDPIEYQIDGINQIQVKPQIGLTFASGLKHIVRQDPDVIMVGEIRDVETAEIAIHSALTGHLVFSTLHTNDAPGAVTRLLDMGIESFLVSSSMIGVLAQRLVRVICPTCKEPHNPPQAMIDKIEALSGCTIYHGAGCEDCRHTGYRGRTGIFEFMPVDEEVRHMILEKASADVIRKKALAGGMQGLRDCGLQKVREGVTTIEEVIRVAQESF